MQASVDRFMIFCKVAEVLYMLHMGNVYVTYKSPSNSKLIFSLEVQHGNNIAFQERKMHFFSPLRYDLNKAAVKEMLWERHSSYDSGQMFKLRKRDMVGGPQKTKEDNEGWEIAGS
jgi:hypothetical protein